MTITPASSTGRARVSDVVGRDRIAADAGRIALGRRNTRTLRTAFKGRDGLLLGRIPALGLDLRRVNAVVHPNPLRRRAAGS